MPLRVISVSGSSGSPSLHSGLGEDKIITESRNRKPVTKMVWDLKGREESNENILFICIMGNIGPSVFGAYLISLYYGLKGSGHPILLFLF